MNYNADFALSLLFYMATLGCIIFVCWSVVVIVNCFRERNELRRQLKGTRQLLHRTENDLRLAIYNLTTNEKELRRTRTHKNWSNECAVDALEEKIASLEKQIIMKDKQLELCGKQLKRNERKESNNGKNID